MYIKPERIEKVKHVLKERYDKKGANFHFKTRKIASSIGENASFVGRVCVVLSKTGVVEVVNSPQNGAMTFRTLF